MEGKGFLLAEFKSSFLYTAKELGLGVAEEVDGLHRIADDEDGATGAIFPCLDERGDELMLAAASVLEFVDKQMANVIGNDECGVRWQLVLGEQDVSGDLCDFDEVDGTGFRKDGLQFARGMAEENKAGPNDLPFFFCIAGGRKLSYPGKCLFETWHR